MSNARHHDLIIIGAGSGNSLITPALEGLDIAMVEQGTFGGTCLNVGCIPTKMFSVVADAVVSGVDAVRLGVTFGEPSVDWPHIRDRVFGHIDPIAAGGEKYRRSQDFVTVYASHAQFVGLRHLRLATGEEITADQVVVAAGARPTMYDIPGLDTVNPSAGVHTSDTVMRLSALPPRMLVLGGGFVACELAHVFSEYGAAVTQVQRSDVLLTHEEPHISKAYTEAAGRRYTVLTGRVPIAATRSDGVWDITVAGPDGSTEVVQAECVLVARGRTRNGDLLDAPAGGMTMSGDRVDVDEFQRTSAEGTWALGDVSSKYQLKHVANHEARVVAHNLEVTFGRTSGDLIASDHRFVPHAVFGHPQIAGFGPTASQLSEQGVEFVTYTQQFSDVAYGWALANRDGLLTVHATPDGQVLAAHGIGLHSATLIQPLIQAASFGQHAHDVARGQYWIHPALSEVVENALLGLAVSAPT